MKKLSLIALALMLALSLAACGSPSEPASSEAPASSAAPEAPSGEPSAAPSATFRIAGMKGPTTMGMVRLMKGAEDGEYANDYQVQMFGTADEIVPKLLSGELDAAAVPCNLASTLYARSQGKVRLAAINTLGVLYVVEIEDSVQSVADLKGKTIYSTGKGTTPEYALNYILRQNGIDPETDVTIEFKSEATEVASMLTASGENAIAVLPQPYVTVAQSNIENLRVALDLTAEWDAVANGESSLVTGVLVARADFIDENPEAFSAFLDDYSASAAFVSEDLDAAAELVAGYGIVPAAPVAKKALPFCNITFIEGDEMQNKASGYLGVLFEQNPQSVGGALPDEAFYYKR